MKTEMNLPESIAELHQLILAQQEEIDLLKDKYQRMLEQFKLAQQRKFKPSSESHPEQLALQFDEAEAVPASELPEEENTIEVSYVRNKPKRKALPKDLPRVVITHDIPEADKLCACGCEKKRIGEAVTEQLEIVPAKLQVIAHVRPKYACNHCDEGVSIAPMPQLFLPKSMASPSLLAHTLVAKYENHLPLYRQEKIWERLGVALARNTVSGWIIKAYELCVPMRKAILSVMLESGYIQTDETPLQVLDEQGRSATSKSYMWVYKTGKLDKKLILFDYRETRQARWPKEMLSDFKGYLQTDGYAGYDWVDTSPDIIHLGCMAHGRRPFAELAKLAKTTGKSHQALVYFQKLYALEKQARDGNYTPKQRHILRQEKALPVLQEFKLWLDKSIVHAQPQSKLANALLYLHERWKELTNYLLDGILEIDNNAVENQIRPFALGRKNWLFAATPNGAHASALFYSLIASATANGLNPFDYLNHLFQNIRQAQTEQDFIDLLPFHSSI